MKYIYIYQTFGLYLSDGWKSFRFNLKKMCDYWIKLDDNKIMLIEKSYIILYDDKKLLMVYGNVWEYDEGLLYICDLQIFILYD